MKILLTTLHAKYSHASLALPCLATACSSIEDAEIVIREYTTNEPRDQLLRLIMTEQAHLIAFSCYIWNIDKTLAIVEDIKKISPDTLILLGGPEASFGVFELMHAYPAIDFIIKGEGEAPFSRLAGLVAEWGGQMPDGSLLQEISNLFFRDGEDVASGPLERRQIPLDCIPSPFAAGLVDVSRPLVYYETSRGCPYSCAFCLSSVEGQVRSYSMERIESDLLLLMEQRQPKIKLVDRTFNYDQRRARQIWRFILDHNQASHFHFEIGAELLDDACIDLLKEVPAETFRFEIGVQSTSTGTLEQVGRKSDLGRLFYVIRRLRAETNVELHLDLLAGLPDENLNGFLASLQAVADLAPHEIQVEPLKVLKGSPMREIAGRKDYRFSSTPPYTILTNPWLSYDDICRIETIGRLLDLFFNNGGFANALQLLTRQEKISRLLNRMAEAAGNQPLSGLSVLRRYELFYSLAHHAGAGVSHLLADALFFDFCTAELPRKGKLPDFMAEREEECCWPGGKELQKNDHGGRARLFRFRFQQDYRTHPWTNSPTEITFSYARQP